MSDRLHASQWYEEYYAKVGKSRNNLRTNREVLFQTLAIEVSMVRAAYAMTHDPQSATVLDVGCGVGGDISYLLKLYYNPARIIGIDILSERVAVARQRYPYIRFEVADANATGFEGGSFDLVFESTMFSTLWDDLLSAGIAREMIRVCKPNGYVLLVDWRVSKPWDGKYRALTRKRVAEWFSVGSETRLLGVYRGALVPPVGRFLSKHLPWAYFAIGAFCPFLVGQAAYLLQKSPGQTAL